MEFGHILKKLRLEHGLTQQQLSDLVKVSKSTISYYEHAQKMPSPAIVAQFANLFNVSIDYLMGIDLPSNGKTLNVDGLTPSDINIVQAMIDALRQKNIKNST